MGYPSYGTWVINLVDTDVLWITLRFAPSYPQDLDNPSGCPQSPQALLLLILGGRVKMTKTDRLQLELKKIAETHKKEINELSYNGPRGGCYVEAIKAEKEIFGPDLKDRSLMIDFLKYFA